MPGIPEPKAKRFYHKSWFVEVLGIPSALVAGVPTIFLAISRIFYPQESTTRSDIALAWIGVAGVTMLVLIGIVKVVQGIWKDTNEADEERLDGLHAALQVIHSLVRHKHAFDRKEADRLRVTIHRIVKPKSRGESPEWFEQVLDYVGGKGGGKGRRFSIRSGITGRAAREDEVFAGSRNNDDYDSYIKELISGWGYTEADARKVSIKTNAWMAVPIKYRGKEITGVVYLDSNEKDFFTDEVKELVVWACGGLAVFIDERYN